MNLLPIDGKSFPSPLHLSDRRLGCLAMGHQGDVGQVRSEISHRGIWKALPVTQARKALIVEDEPVIRTTMSEFLTGEGFVVVTAGSVTEAVSRATEQAFDVAICDVQLPDGDGIALLRKLQQIDASTAVLIITAYATVENAIEAFQAGAFDYLVKPVLFEDLLHKLNRLFRFRELYLENQALRSELARLDRCDEIVGSSNALAAVHAQVWKVAATNANVLLGGESGTGKELFARAIHRNGPHADQPFLAVDCSVSPVEQIEAQLFGGNTAAGAEQDGVFRAAGAGTVYLDEIADLPLGTQAKLLRAIEYGEIMPIGSTRVTQVEARIIASTSADLREAVSDATFQEDLFYRLDGVKIRIPPLRERLDDIPELVEFFIAKHSRTMRKRVSHATGETIRLLMSAQWKGNVRQLDNAIERAVMMCDGMQIQPADLPPDLLGIEQPLPDTDDLRTALRHYERLHITRVLRQCPDKREAAKRLRLGLSSLYRKIEELKVEV